jgi:hypothetical protein
MGLQVVHDEINLLLRILPTDLVLETQKLPARPAQIMG